MLVSLLNYRGPQGIGLKIFYVSLTLIDRSPTDFFIKLFVACGGDERKPESSLHAE
jgi:hypothetical protein